jgi:hypothetical protein
MRKLSWGRRAAALGIIASCAALVGIGPAQATSSQAHASALPSRTTLEDLATRFVLDSNQSGSVYTLPRNGGAYQSWNADPSDFGSVTLRNVATNRCLDSNTSGEVYTLPCNGGSFQKWLVKSGDFGTVVLQDLATGFVLDSNADGSVYTLPRNGGSYQMWISAAA